MIKRTLLFILLLLNFVMPTYSQGQEFSATGIIQDQNGVPISGATIIEQENSQNGTISGNGGEFSVRIKEGTYLLVSFIGYETVQFAPVVGKKSIITLNEDDQKIDDVVVVGYGTMLKSDLTGSITKIINEDSESKGYTSFESLIQGKTAGAQITQNTGALGGGMSFSIRGSSSVSGSSEPLVVIDGYPVDSGTENVSIGGDSSYEQQSGGQNALASLNPNDIESIEILKDASSTAIYGSRGANGVVMITTKKGAKGKAKLNYNLRLAMSNVGKFYDVLSTEEYLAYSNEAYMSKRDGSVAYSQSKIDELSGVNTNWQEEIYRTGVSNEHQLTLSGGTDRIRYSVSAGHLDQTGVVESTEYTRNTLRANLIADITPKLNFNLMVNGSMSENHAVNQSTTASAIDGSVVTAALFTAPIYEAYSDGDLNDDGTFTNPLVLVKKSEDVNKQTQIRTNATLKYQITKDLSFSFRGGVNSNNLKRNYYMPTGTYKGDLTNGYAYEGYTQKFDYLSESIFSYNKKINKKHRINAMAGYTWQEWRTEKLGMATTGYIDDDLSYYNVSLAESINTPSSSTQEWALSSLLARVNYVFDNRYLLTASTRYDGSTRLADGQKWALFPSFALGWNIHNEPFMRECENVSQLKIRASYGVSGNQSIGVGSTVSTYNSSTGVMGEETVVGLVPSNIANDNLKWETTSQYNLGVDIGFVRDRFRLSVDVYRKITKDLLINLPLPESTGYDSYATNAGRVRNQGLEIEAFADIFNKNVKWSVAANISFNRNKILEFDGTITQFLSGSFANLAGQSPSIAQVGSPIGMFYGYVIEGIYQNQAEVSSHAQDPSNPSPGDFKFSDISGPDGVPDGIISDYDKTVIGNPYPDYTFGITNNVGWRNLSLSIFIMGSIGQDIMNGNRFYLDALSRTTSYNVSREAYENRWTGEGTSNKYPSAQSTQTPFMGRVTNFIVEDGSYVKLKNITLSYNIPIKNKKVVSSAKVFVSADNIFTITGYSGYDPEINSRGNDPLTQGIDIGSIPQFKTYSAGVNVSF